MPAAGAALAPAYNPAMPLGYHQALDYVVATGSRGIKAGLERTQALLEALGEPHRGLQGVLVAGTNGKGSVCALVDAACRAAGRRTALLVKPHLRSYRERIVLDGRPVDREHFAALVARVQPAVEAVEPVVGAPTQFEILTVLGILAAAEHGAEVVVCEVGLGGRLDSTNVLDLGVAVVTTVALDHRQYLGDTVAAIAAEKAGILKPGNDAVTGATGEALEVVRRRAAEVGVRRLAVVGEEVSIAAARSRKTAGIEVSLDLPSWGRLDLCLPLCGLFQAHNAAVAAGTCRALDERGARLGPEAVVAGFAQVRWPGRLQVIEGEPLVVLDGAHNPAALAAVVPAVAEIRGERPLVVVFGAMADKDLDAMLAELRPLAATMVFTQAATPRAASATDLARRWGHDARAVARLEEAVEAARLLAGRGGVVLVCGSLYLVGEALGLLTPAPVP